MIFPHRALLADAEQFLRLLGMMTLATAVAAAARRLGHDKPETEIKRAEHGEPLTGSRVIVRKNGERAWWQIPVEERETVLALLQQHLTARDPLDHLGLFVPPHAEALRAAVELLTPDWRTSVLTQLASIDKAEDVAAAQVALEVHALSGRPVFESDDQGGPRPPGLGEPCEVCGAQAGVYCDPTKHPEVAGEG